MRYPEVSLGANIHPSVNALANDFQHWLTILSLFQLRLLNSYVIVHVVLTLCSSRTYLSSHFLPNVTAALLSFI